MAVMTVQKFLRAAVLALLAVFTLAPAVYAHGQFDPAEMGAPIAVSAVLGVASFWLVRLWPAARPVRDSGGNNHRIRRERDRGRRRRSRAKISLVP
jgi:hypothetical protein